MIDVTDKFLSRGKCDDNMATSKHATKRGVHSLSNSTLNTPIKPVKSKIPKRNDTPIKMNKENEDEPIDLRQIHDMFQGIMTKLEKLDTIETKVKCIEDDLKEIESSVEYAHAEITDLKKDNVTMKTETKEMKRRLENVEQQCASMNNSLIDLKARSMRDNLIFYNMPENKDENTTDVILSLLESKFGMKEAKSKVKIDRSRRVGREKVIRSPGQL
jgi:chromosome segregation ATPase